MNMAFMNQVADIKARVMELAWALTTQPEEEFNREHAIIDLMGVCEQLHLLEGKCLKSVSETDMRVVQDLAEYKERMYRSGDCNDQAHVKGGREDGKAISG